MKNEELIIFSRIWNNSELIPLFPCAKGYPKGYLCSLIIQACQ